MEYNKTTIIINVTSTFHLYGALSYLIAAELLNKGNEFIIISNKNFRSDYSFYAVNEKDFKILDSEKKLLCYDKDFSFSIFQDRKTNFKIISPEFVPYRFISKLQEVIGKQKIEVIKIDEGIGTYESLLERLKFCSNVEKKSLVYLFIRHILKQPYLFFFRIKFVKSCEAFFLFSKRRSKLYQNNYVVSAYRKYFEKEKNEQYNIMSGDKNIVFFSDCIEDYLIDKTKKEYIYIILINLIKEKYPDYNLYFKPHPTEIKSIDLESLGCNVIKQSITTENLVNNNIIFHCFSVCSTSLITSSLFFNKDCTSMVDYIPEAYLLHEKKKFIKTFKNRFSTISNLSFKL